LPEETAYQDAAWWQTIAKERDSDPEFEIDPVSGQGLISFNQSIRDPESGAFLGVIRAEVSATDFEAVISKTLDTTLGESFVVQMLDFELKTVLDTFGSEASGSVAQNQALIGEEPILETAVLMGESLEEEEEEKDTESEATQDEQANPGQDPLPNQNDNLSNQSESAEQEDIRSTELAEADTRDESIETLVYLDTEKYSVRIYEKDEQVLMNLYDQEQKRSIFEKVPSQKTSPDGSITYAVTQDEATYSIRILANNSAELNIATAAGDTTTFPALKASLDQSDEDEEEESEESEQPMNLDSIQQAIEKQLGVKVDLSLTEEDGDPVLNAHFLYQGRDFDISTVPATDLVVLSSIDTNEIAQAGQDLATALGLTGLVLAIAAGGAIVLLAQSLTQPLQQLTQATLKVAAGDFDTTAPLVGPVETQSLAQTFNDLVARVKTLLQEQSLLALEQQQQRERLEQDILQLMEETRGAVEGDLTVKATLKASDVGIVADLVNTIVDSLSEIALQVKGSTRQVSRSLHQSQSSIQSLANESIQEAAKATETLQSVQDMVNSIAEVAQQANQAAEVAQDTFITTQDSSLNMRNTVDSILKLRATVAETAKKMKRLGESTQKISQVVSLIDEIALKTNLLAINTSVEAGKAGEFGQGFAVVAEQVGSLAAQASEATQEIAQLVYDIQTEAQEVSKDMEVGTTQVVESTQQVELTQKRLEEVLQKAQTISQLMALISRTTISQTTSAKEIESLMQALSQSSLYRAELASDTATQIELTARVSQTLQESVDQFKLPSSPDESDTPEEQPRIHVRQDQPATVLV
jgi:methyl-accepting chemotaxis protein